MKNEFDFEDERHEDSSPTNPAGKARVTFDVPMPTVEQVCGEIARQIMGSQHYQDQNAIRKRAREILDETCAQIIGEKAVPIIEELLAKPLQRTDGFGQPIGEPTSLHAVLAGHVTDWASATVDSDGRPAKKDSYNRAHPRINWELGRIVNGDLSKLVRAETDKIIAQLRDSATQNIAKQIGEQVSRLVLK